MIRNHSFNPNPHQAITVHHREFLFAAYDAVIKLFIPTTQNTVYQVVHNICNTHGWTMTMVEKPAFVDGKKQFTTEVFSFHLPLFLKEFILFYFIFRLQFDKTPLLSCMLGPAQHTAQRIRPCGITRGSSKDERLEVRNSLLSLLHGPSVIFKKKNWYFKSADAKWRQQTFKIM